jgi:predicted O-linked N-acetylglucosamine transferase (SPINDLY family)
LTHLGLDQWVAEDEEELVQLASKLAADRNAIADWRLRLRERVMASPLMNAEKLTRDLERAYRDMWAGEQS